MIRKKGTDEMLIIRIIALALLPSLFLASTTTAAEFDQTPTLKWKLGGCYSSWCETGWYSSPAVADLDGDGEKEILFSSYDGRVHAFWLDKTEHHNWPYSIYKPGESYYRFGAEPVIADLNNDGFAEIIIASWVQKGSLQSGRLNVLNYMGNLVNEVALPDAFGSADWNGVLAAPTLADIDGDDNLEIVLNTAHSGVVAYDLPGTTHARILWGTGRGNYYRDGLYRAEEKKQYLPGVQILLFD